METKKQTEKILLYLRETGSITPIDALREFGCMRLGARIWDLKNKEGYDIRSTIETNTNRFGDKVHYARYTLYENGVQ